MKRKWLWLLFGLPILRLPLFWWLPLPMALALYVPASALRD